jgi:hypothetical protein
MLDFLEVGRRLVNILYPFFRRISSPFQHKNKPIITVYETQANLADHEKIQGLDGMSSAPGH